jgi:IgGFc binding protein/HYR domain-containing protein
VLAAAGLGAGQFYQAILTHAAYLVTDKPVLTAQFGNSSRYDRVRNADPLMVLVPPTRLFDSHYEIATPTWDFPTNFVNLVVPAEALGQVLWDGLAIPAAAFVPVGVSGYYALQQPVPPSAASVHQVSSANGNAFGLIAYGWSVYDAYGYPGGICLPTFAPAPLFTCPPGQALAYADSNCVARVPDLRGQIGQGEAAVLVTQDPAPGSLAGVGAHDIVTTAYDAAGGDFRCVTVFTVADTSVLRCPGNIVAACDAPEGAHVTYPVPRLCDTNLVVECLPPPGSLFPIGTNTVTCTVWNGINVVDQCSFTITVDLSPTCQVISVKSSQNGYLLSFPPGGGLLVTTNIAGPYAPVPGATSPYLLPIQSKSQSFYKWSSTGQP